MRTQTIPSALVAATLAIFLLGPACTSAPRQKKISALPASALQPTASPSTGSAISVVSPHQEQSCKGNWHVLDTPNPNHSGNLLVGIDPSGELTNTLILHWNGQRWAVTDSPSPGSRNELQAVDGSAADDVWAVGFTSNGGPARALILRWDGAAWTEVPSPNSGRGGNYLFGVTALSPDDVWAVGASGDVDHANGVPLIEHWDGRNWTVVPSAEPGTKGQQFFAAAGASPDDVWAVGFDGSGGGSRPLIEHWRGKSWERVQVPNSVGPLHQVTAPAGDDVWASGTNFLHWDGRKWTEVEVSRRPGQEWHFSGLAALSRNDLWTVGFGFSASDPPGDTHPILGQWNGRGWKTKVGPGQPPIWLVSASATAGQVWAAGFRSGAYGIMQTFVQVCR